jgi:NAD(P) transhydrogenase
MTETLYDLLVIGSGPAGQKAAIQGAKAGCRVALVERDRHIGGACVHTGTIPSKALRERALRPDARTLRTLPLSRLLGDVAQIAAEHDRYMAAQLARNAIDVIRGRARFLGPRRLDVLDVHGHHRMVAAPRIIIATGSRPRSPAEFTVDHETIVDSDSILGLPGVPQSLIVLGGGVIASEYASVFARLGSVVTQVDRAPRPLAFVDEELAGAYVASLAHCGGRYLGQHRPCAARWDGGRQRCVVERDDDSTLEADKVLVALGRVANVEGLDLDKAGLELTESGHIAVDSGYRTAVDGVFAAGDVIGPPALASAAMEQGRRAACAALGLPGEPDEQTSLPVPTGVYTLPEIASVGLDAAAAAKQGRSVRIGRAPFAEIARAQISRNTQGLLKLVADASTLRILGVQAVGDSATELVHAGQLAIAARVSAETLVDAVFNFPTYAESYRVAALDLLRDRSAGRQDAIIAA